MQFEILGELRALRAGKPLALGGPIAQRLLAALLVGAPRVVERDMLIERLWGSRPPATARTALQVHIGRLRRALEPDHQGGPWSVVRTTGNGYALEIDRAWIDADHFESLVRRAEERADADPRSALDDVESARALWRGRAWGALADEPWLRADVARIEELQRRADELWADVQLALGRHEVMVDSLTAAVEEQPLRERRWEQLMLAQYRSGRQAEALRGFQDARRILTEELGIEPSPTLRALEHAVLVQDPSLDAPPRSVPERARHNLPVAITTLLGRGDEVVVTQKLLEGSRLVTITGTAGCGKTRVALAVAEGLVDHYDNGVWFVDLAAASSAELVASQIASDLEVREGNEHGPEGPLALLMTYLRDRQLLLVLDNCEHVVDEVAMLVCSLLSSCPGLRVLATSRLAIGVVGEAVKALSPLDTPAVEAPLEELVSSPAVQLFVERATDAGASYDPTSVPAELTAIGELCRFLDGVPLAIELAAMWTPTLAPSEIRARLGSRLSLVATNDRIPERQRALRSTVEWSYALLSESERVALRRLSVFPAGFTLAGAAAVIVGDNSESDAVIGTIGRLVRSSLVRRSDHVAPARYRMLETVREYAAEQLHSSGDVDETHAHQLDYLVGLAHNVRREEFFGPPVDEVMAALDGEHENVREVLEQLLVSGQGDQALLLAGAMGTYWFERGHWGEGQRWLTRALRLTPESRSVDRARALTALAQTSASFAGIATRVDELEEAVEIYREHDPHRHLIATLMYLWLARAWRRETSLICAVSTEVKQIAAGLKNRWIDTTIAVYDSLALVLEGQLAAAHAGLVKGAAALVDLRDDSLAARALMYAGNVSRLMDDLPAARHELEQSMELARTNAIHGTYAHGMLAVAQVAMELGDADAPSLFLECLAVLEVIGDVRCTAVCQRSLGSLALDRDRPEDALQWLKQSLEGLATHDQRSLAVAIADIAMIRARRGESADAVWLVAAAETLAQQPGVPIAANERSRIDAAADMTKAKLDTVSTDVAMGEEALDVELLLEVARRT
jgi:predicted ATPase/DNA-binding SARP family transcriptional activator